MKSTNLEVEMGVGGKFFSICSYNQYCPEVSILVILLLYVYPCYIMLKKQRKVVLRAYEMHYFKLTAVRN